MRLRKGMKRSQPVVVYIGPSIETNTRKEWTMLFKIKINNDVVYEIEARSADTAKKLAKTKFKKEFKRVDIKLVEVE